MKRYLALLITFVLVGCEDKMKIYEITKVSEMNSPFARLGVYGGQAGEFIRYIAKQLLRQKRLLKLK